MDGQGEPVVLSLWCLSIASVKNVFSLHSHLLSVSTLLFLYSILALYFPFLLLFGNLSSNKLNFVMLKNQHLDTEIVHACWDVHRFGVSKIVEEFPAW